MNSIQICFNRKERKEKNAKCAILFLVKIR